MKRLGSLVAFVCVATFMEHCTCTVHYSVGRNWKEEVEHGKLDKCSALLEDFAKSASNFSHCAVKRARPFEFCCMCSSQYSSILEVKDRIYGDKDCVSELVWSEKYQIIERVFEFAKTLWFTSHCQGCFETHSNLGEKWKLTNVVVTFFQRLRELEVCFKNYTRAQLIPMRNATMNGSVSNTTSYNSANLTNPRIICQKCQSFYHSVQKAYKDVVNGGQTHDDINKEDTICADVAAAMNYTRHTWSGEYDCTNPQADLVSVLALTCFFAFLPIVFYGATKLHGQAKEKKQENSGLPRINYDTE